jgi:hypothetical protein
MSTESHSIQRAGSDVIIAPDASKKSDLRSEI